MGNLDVIHIGDWKDKRIQALPRSQELVATIVRSELQPVGPLGDQDLELTFEVIAGPSKGRRILQRIPLLCRDERLRIRGRVALSTLCRALGVPHASDSAQLHGRPVVLRLTRKRGSENEPHADYSACSEADHQAWEQALARAEQGGEGQTRAER
jgi:hypothetical protein